MIALMTATLRRGLLAAGLLAIASAAALSQAPAPPVTHDEDGMQVMSDTPQWCVHLAEQVAELRRSVTGQHQQADKLAHDGERLCAAGHVRLGITRLRYALMRLEGH